MVMKDGFDRVIDYVRVSVTEMCNLNCGYCMPQGAKKRAGDLLSMDEIYRIIRIISGLGARKVRLTGGEPLIFENLFELAEKIKATDGIETVALTTNGTMIKKYAKDITRSIDAVNVSLDALTPCVFSKITGAGGELLSDILEGIDTLLSSDVRVKINCVPIRGINDDEADNIALLAMSKPIDVRFIELMPIGAGKRLTGVKSDEILSRLEERFGKAAELTASAFAGPARYYAFEGFIGRVGFISPISHKFCSECNRVRLTADGFLKLCLQYDYGVDLKTLLRSGASDNEIALAILSAVCDKPRAHSFDAPSGLPHEEKRPMNRIGG